MGLVRTIWTFKAFIGTSFLGLLEKSMNNDKKFPEQEAPEKNTDNAFVQVGEDGSPVIPSADKTKSETDNEDSATTPDKR